jgi:hypothetical protein
VWRRVDVVDWTDVSEDRIASIFRVEKSASEEPAWAGSCSPQKTAFFNIIFICNLKDNSTKYDLIRFFCSVSFLSIAYFPLTMCSKMLSVGNVVCLLVKYFDLYLLPILALIKWDYPTDFLPLSIVIFFTPLRGTSKRSKKRSAEN